ncbi:MAG: hypothetical protein ACLGIM_20140 [Alphaproteobacteria bacterium]
MTYRISRRDGTLIASVADNTILDGVVPITLIGRGSINFGPAINQNVLYLMENFAGVAPPSNPVSGMLWFDSGADRLKVQNTSGEWRDLMTVGMTIGNDIDLTDGNDNGSNLSNEGIFTLRRTDGRARIVFKHSPDRESVTLVQSGTDLSVEGGTLRIGTYGVWHAGNFNPDSKLGLSGGTVTGPLILTGPLTANDGINTNTITVSGDATVLGTLRANIGHFTGNVTIEGDLIARNGHFTGDVQIDGDLNVDAITTNDLTVRNIRLVNPTASDFIIKNDTNNLNRVGPYSGDLGTAASKFSTIYAGTFNGTATQAQYADLAERHAADRFYPAGTILKVGGAAEVTETVSQHDPMLGVVSEKPGFLMNEAAGPDATHPMVGLIGRVRVRVVGPVSKGDRLLISDTPGCAEASPARELRDDIETFFRATFGTVGFALEDKLDPAEGLVLAVIGVR